MFSTKYRKKILTKEIELYLQDLFQTIADDKEFIPCPPAKLYL